MIIAAPTYPWSSVTVRRAPAIHSRVDGTHMSSPVMSATRKKKA